MYYYLQDREKTDNKYLPDGRFLLRLEHPVRLLYARNSEWVVGKGIPAFLLRGGIIFSPEVENDVRARLRAAFMARLIASSPLID